MRALGIGGALLLLAGCAPAPIEVKAQVDCAHPPAFDGNVIQAQSTGGTVFAVLFTTGAITAGVETKIVWRITGTGPARFSATGPDFQAVGPTWGPEGHGGSTLDVPGEEWGTGFAFPTRGCWTIHVARDDVNGSLSLPVG
ncbi:hypothetical protein [Amycolatopsis sp. NPDC059657]|uniref:hypothetical protein n=1 Tax=Amycolatopsis sp. NPDC059657 TaxID=3346899 RepID=UPI0036706A8E